MQRPGRIASCGLSLVSARPGLRTKTSSVGDGFAVARQRSFRRVWQERSEPVAGFVWRPDVHISPDFTNFDALFDDAKPANPSD
jgi:hypothetical protein